MSFLRRVQLVAIALLLLPLSCRRGDDLSGVVRGYLQLTVALSERDPDALDFYVGPKDLETEARRKPMTLREIATEASYLDAKLAGLQANGEEADRVAFLRGQLRAVGYRVRMLQGRSATFDEESVALFGVGVQPDSDGARREILRTQIGKEIGVGAHAYTVYDMQFQVRPERVRDVFDAALRVCRAETVRHIALPVGERVTVEFVRHKPWSAFSRYLGGAQSLIQVNMDYPLTVDRILDLACHEGYPGHHVFNLLRDASLARAEPEWGAQLTFSPQSFVSESAASYAPELAFGDAARLRVEREVLFPAAGLNPARAETYVRVSRMVAALHTAEPGIAREYLDGRLEFVRAADALERETLMEHAENALLYLNEYRSYVLTYTQGRDGVAAWVGDGGEEERWRRYESLMRRPVGALPAF